MASGDSGFASDEIFNSLNNVIQKEFAPENQPGATDAGKATGNKDPKQEAGQNSDQPSASGAPDDNTLTPEEKAIKLHGRYSTSNEVWQAAQLEWLKTIGSGAAEITDPSLKRAIAQIEGSPEIKDGIQRMSDATKQYTWVMEGKMLGGINSDPSYVPGVEMGALEMITRAGMTGASDKLNKSISDGMTSNGIADNAAARHQIEVDTGNAVFKQMQEYNLEHADRGALPVPDARDKTPAAGKGIGG